LLDVNFSVPVFGLVDRLVVAADQRSRIVDAVEIGYREAGEVISKPRFAMEMRERRNGCVFRNASSARTTAAATKSPSRGCFRLTIRMARVRVARASATPSISISISSSPTKKKL